MKSITDITAKVLVLIALGISACAKKDPVAQQTDNASPQLRRCKNSGSAGEALLGEEGTKIKIHAGKVSCEL